MSDDDPRVIIARACRELLDVYAREPELYARVMTLVTPQDVETLRELATWDQGLVPDD